MYFVFIDGNRTMKPAEIDLYEGGKGDEGEKMEGMNLRYTVTIYVNVTMYSPVQL
jgi:hypothetical protein